MFGTYYAKRDASLLTKEWTREEYAIELLAELVNRARILEPIYMKCVEATDESPDQQQYLNELAGAVEVFLRDLDEARIRGARARLFCRSSFGSVEPASIDSSDLADIGGSLVPWHEDEPAAGERGVAK